MIMNSPLLHTQAQSLLERHQMLLSDFHLNSHTLKFHPWTQKLGPPCTTQQTAPQGSAA